MRGTQGVRRISSDNHPILTVCTYLWPLRGLRRRCERWVRCCRNLYIRCKPQPNFSTSTTNQFTSSFSPSPHVEELATPSVNNPLHNQTSWSGYSSLFWLSLPFWLLRLPSLNSHGPPHFLLQPLNVPVQMAARGAHLVLAFIFLGKLLMDLYVTLFYIPCDSIVPTLFILYDRLQYYGLRINQLFKSSVTLQSHGLHTWRTFSMMTSVI